MRTCAVTVGLAQPPAEVIAAEGLERVRIDAVRAAVLLGHQQPAGVPHRRGVGDGAVEAGCLGLVGERIAVLAEQRAPGGHLGLVPLGLDIADRETRPPPARSAPPTPCRRRRARRHRLPCRARRRDRAWRGRTCPRPRLECALDRAAPSSSYSSPIGAFRPVNSGVSGKLRTVMCRVQADSGEDDDARGCRLFGKRVSGEPQGERAHLDAGARRGGIRRAGGLSKATCGTQCARPGRCRGS